MSISHAQFLEMLARTNRGKGREKQESKPDPGNEADLHCKIIDECKRRGWVFLHGSMATATHRTAGEPDFVIFGTWGSEEGTYSPHVWAIECKSRIGKLSPAQNAMKAHLEKLGHRYHIVRSFAEFLEVIR